jgi:hypothetical protein
MGDDLKSKQRGSDGVAHSANSPASQITARTRGVVKNKEWLTALTDTNQKMRKPTSLAAQKGFSNP